VGGAETATGRSGWREPVDRCGNAIPFDRPKKRVTFPSSHEGPGSVPSWIGRIAFADPRPMLWVQDQQGELFHTA
jgi:hypothetical protein